MRLLGSSQTGSGYFPTLQPLNAQVSEVSAPANQLQVMFHDIELLKDFLPLDQFERSNIPLSRFSMTLTPSPVDGRTLYATDDVEEYQMFCQCSLSGHVG
jgi:hypothetical protein